MNTVSIHPNHELLSRQTTYISGNRLSLQEEVSMLQRRLRTSNDLHPNEVGYLRQRLNSVTEELQRTSIPHTATNPFGSDFLPPNPDTLPLHLLLEANGVIYGSRGLHIENQYSDYDLAFSCEQHKELYTRLINDRLPSFSPTEYFQSTPEAGYRIFFQHKLRDHEADKKVKVDILFVHTDEDLDVIRSSMQDLLSIPQYMLQDKSFRINAYNKALQHRGWTPTLTLNSSEDIPW